MYYCKNIAIVLDQQCKLGFDENVNFFFHGEYLYKALTIKISLPAHYYFLPTMQEHIL